MPENAYQVPLDHEFFAAGFALEIFDARMGFHVPHQLLGGAKGHVTVMAQVEPLVHLASMRIARPARVEGSVAGRTGVAFWLFDGSQGLDLTFDLLL
jgi:hypothetical protein